MNKQEFRDWIYEHYNVPDYNFTLAPDMLDGILTYAVTLSGDDRYYFLSLMFPCFPDEILRNLNF